MDNYVPGVQIPENAVGALLLEAAITFQAGGTCPSFSAAEFKSVRSLNKNFKHLTHVQYSIKKLKVVKADQVSQMLANMGNCLPGIETLHLPFLKGKDAPNTHLKIRASHFPSLKHLECTIVDKGWGASLGNFISRLTSLASLSIDFNRSTDCYFSQNVKAKDVLDLLMRLTNGKSMLKQLEFRRLRLCEDSFSAAAKTITAISSKAKNLEKLTLIDCMFVNIAYTSDFFKSKDCMPNLTELTIAGELEPEVLDVPEEFLYEQLLPPRSITFPAWPKLQKLTLTDPICKQRLFETVAEAPWFKQLTYLHLEMLQTPLQFFNVHTGVNLETLKLTFDRDTQYYIWECRHPSLKELVLVKKGKEYQDEDYFQFYVEDANPVVVSNFPALQRLQCHDEDIDVVLFVVEPKFFNMFDVSQPPAADSQLQHIILHSVRMVGKETLRRLAADWLPKLKSFELHQQ